MIEHSFPNLHERYTHHQLRNGLNVYIVSKPHIKTQTAYLATPFGAFDLKQRINDVEVSFKAGTAHFLEHKLFENSQGVDVMKRFNELGANVNAFTSHHETAYYFKTSRANFKKELNLLLDFVQSFSIDEASVEKEKGIIVQELRMYQQIPEQRLLNETYQALFSHHPIRYDIGGDETSVSSITKDDLERAYTTNYHPSRCVLVVMTSLEAKRILSWIEANQEPKIFGPSVNVTRCITKESNEPVRTLTRFNMDLQNTKMTLSFKLNLPTEDEMLNLTNEWRLRFLLELLFTSIHPNYQMWLKSQRIHDYFGYDVEVDQGCAYVMFYIESDDPDDFKDLILKQLKTPLEVVHDHFELLNRRYSAQILRSFDDLDDYAMTLFRAHFSDLKLDTLFEQIQSITFDALKNLQHDLINYQPSLVVMEPLSSVLDASNA
jgi:predicted Zn-dependent peptidase